MIATYVIGLREGLEAALIVGIVAAFLRQQGHTRALRSVWIGVIIATLFCAAGGVALQILNQELPQRQQDMLETVLAVGAVAIVTFMVVWMRRHSRGLKTELEAHAAAALATGSVFALVAMAFFAVLREGLETAVFLLAAFRAADNEGTAGVGALLGMLTAVILGAGLYRGGISINLARFFRVTSVVLVIIAGGLPATAVHAAHEAAWFNSFQGQAVNLSWLVVPGTATSSLLTGMLGLQPLPTYAEAGVWLIYVIPMLLFVLWPQAQPLGRPASPVRFSNDAGGHNSELTQANRKSSRSWSTPWMSLARGGRQGQRSVGSRSRRLRSMRGLTSFAPARSHVMSEPPPISTSSFEQHDNQGLRLADASVLRTRDMELCLACGSRLVHPVSWEEAPGGFTVLLRCPECLVHVVDAFSDAELERYDAVLDEGGRALIADLKMLARANMKEFVRQFSSALRAGHIQPEDF